EVRVDICHFDLQYPKSGGKDGKATEIPVSNESHVKKSMERCDGLRRRDHPGGPDYARLAPRWAKEFARAVLLAHQRRNSTCAMEHGAFATGDLMDLLVGESDDAFDYDNVGDYEELPTELPDGPECPRVARRRITDMGADAVLRGVKMTTLDRAAKLKAQMWHEPEPVPGDLGARASQLGPGSSECSSKDPAALRQLRQNLGYSSK
ncbi:unnamed protein product, partial [Prorocentrum cordatum]